MKQLTFFTLPCKTYFRVSVKKWLLIVALLCTPFTQSKAQVYDYTALQGAGDYYTYAQFRIYVPDTVSSIRGIYSKVAGLGGDSRPIVDDTAFRKLCDETGFALLGIRFDYGLVSTRTREQNGQYQTTFGLYKSVVRALNSFATQSVHPEIEYAPIFFDGFSAGGFFSHHFTWWNPKIVIGFIADKTTTGTDTTDVGPAKQVPGYLIAGEFNPTNDPTPSFEKNRPNGALWSLAVEPGADHSPITDRDLLDNYFKDVIELRLPETIIPGQPVVLNTIEESIGWLGDRSTFEIAQYDSFPGEKSQACWFPSEEVAQRWQNFVSGGNASEFQESHSSNKEHIDLIPQQLSSYLNDSNPFHPTRMNVGKSNVQFSPGKPLSEADASFIGESAGDNSGYSVASAGDVNGDGFDDFLIGAYGKDGGGLGGTNKGITYLILGSGANWGMDFNLSQADASFLGEAGLDLSGFSVASAGDVNGDGLDDFLIGALLNTVGGNNDAGKTYLILGRVMADWGSEFDLSQADASFIGEASSDWSGAHISSAGDVNGDGLDDFLIGAEGKDGDPGYNMGATYLVLGRAAADWGINYSLSKADASFIGETPLDYSGYSVASAGDVNGDGMDDFLVGTLLNFKNEGKDDSQTYLILGRAAADWGINYSLSQANASFVGEARFDFSGHSMASAGDVNGDGLDDFLIGAHDNSEAGYFSGQVYLLLGKVAADWGMDFNLSQADASFIGEAAFDVSGFSVASAGDMNGDGLDDFLIGAPNNNESGQFVGKTYLLFGRDAADWGMDFNLSETDTSYTGEAVQDLSGSSIASAGDVDGDGLDDILISALKNDEGAVEAGQTYLLLGAKVPTSIADERPIPSELGLFQNYPNPFNPSTEIQFDVPISSKVTVEIYNLLGQKIRTLIDENRPAGSYQVTWDGKDANNIFVSSGIYLYRLQAGKFMETNKMLLVR